MGSIEENYAVQETSVKVLVIGGSYGGLSAALNLLDLSCGRDSRFRAQDPGAAYVEKPKVAIEIKVVDERDGYYHLIGSPLALASEEYAEKAWVKFDDIPALKAKGVSHMQGRVTKVDPENKTAMITSTTSGEEIHESYDYLVVSSGLRRQWPAVPQSLTRKQYLSEAVGHGRAARNSKEAVVVIGGGAVGIEMAAELKLVSPESTVKLIHSREKLLSAEPLPDDFKDRTASVLKEAGVELILGQRVNEITTVGTVDGPRYDLKLSDGSVLTAGHVISAISKSIPTSTFLPEKSLDEEGYVRILPTMQFTNSTPNPIFHFAVGDICSWSGIKRCGAALAMGHIAAVNIHQQLLQKRFGTEPKFLEFPEVPPMIALAVGKEAVMYGPEEGTTWGEDRMEMMFGKDLGWSICWNYLRLGHEDYPTAT